MYLKRLDIQGFKTFAEKTQIVFSPGVTCVIGPNGSGKSNIADAILWVLGEANVRSLRGSSAQDVIFAGNDRRRPLGMAEVSLTIDNSERFLPLDFSEITVTRRLYRSGESEYQINKVSCRLKDIYELFLDTGVGRDAYSMIGQGEIDQILSVRSEDRRAIFEEAAGIKKYRVRKREAERKLENTAQNLLRVADIIAEIEAQLAPLQRQAAAARRYRDLNGRLRALEDAWYGAKLKRLNAERESLATLVRDLREERARLDGELAAAQAGEKEARAALQRLDQRSEALRREETEALQRVAAAETERARAEERAGEVRRRLRALENDLEDLTGRIREQVGRQEAADRDEFDLRKGVDALRLELAQAQAAAAEKAREHQSSAGELEGRRQVYLARARRQADLEARVQSGEARVKSLEAQQGRAAEALRDGEADLARLTEERESFLRAAGEGKEAAAALAAGVDALRAAGRTAEATVNTTRAASEAATKRLGAHQARLQALSELGERGEGAAAGAKRLLDAARRGEVRGEWSLLVERLRVPEGLEKAVEAALGVYADALLCDSEEHARAGLEWLRGKKASALVLPGAPDQLSIVDCQFTIDNSPSHETRMFAPMLHGEEPALAWARHLLSGAVLCTSLQEAAAHRASLIPHPSSLIPQMWVTRDGAWLARSGAMSGGPLGAEGAAAAALARRRELDRLRAELPELESAAAAAREAQRTAEESQRGAQATLREKQTAAEAARLEQQSRLREADRRNGDAERARHRAERLRADLARAEREHAASLESWRDVQKELQAQDSAPDGPAAEPDLAAAQAAVGKLELERREREARVSDLRVRLAETEQRLQSAAAAARRAADSGVYLDRQRGERLREQRSLTAEAEQRQLQFGSLAQAAAEAEAAVQRAREGHAAIVEERATGTRALNEAAARATDLTNRLRELMERSHRAEVELTAVDTQREQYGSQWLESALAAFGEDEGEENSQFSMPNSQSPSAAAEVHSTEAADDGSAIRNPQSAIRNRPTVESLLAAWDPQEAEQTLTSYSDPEGEIARLRRQIRALGAVNPDAPEQYDAARERHVFLTEQRADLEAAREQLEVAIQEIDTASRETFMEAFRKIAAAFDEMFKRLFGGGATDLRLTDPSDVLETGIDVIVQPPGKKQQNLLLLSGGERALTAAAMLFALLTVRPSPFCVLDEVDAPLDEGNVGRFTRLLREFSQRTQFIVVTHNRGSMEAANTLYGVTMEERGVSKILSVSLDDPIVETVEAEGRSAPAAV